MIRFAIVAFLAALFLWVPWMGGKTEAEIGETILAAYGPMPASCYDIDGELLQEGIAVRWYPLGRMVHTCMGDYVLWFWGDVQELGGVGKKAEDIRPVASRSLSCVEVLERKEARRATSTDSELVPYAGAPAAEPDVSMFPAAAERISLLTVALQRGVDFAGRFAVAEWECGASCISYAFLDVETGRVVSYDLQTEYGATYTRESTLFVTNPVSLLPELPETTYETETLALSLARVPREYYRLTYDALSDTRYLVRECVENSTNGYIEVEDDRIGVVEETIGR